MTDQKIFLPGNEDIVAAARRLNGYARVTPLIDSAAASAASDASVFLKTETLQHTGSFKFRGAFNLLNQLSAEQKANGVVAYSSGNHAQAVAKVAQMQEIRATIVMPSDAPQIKIQSTENFGADVVLYDRYKESREDIAAGIVDDRGATLVPPYDHPDTIAGQGTVGLEITDQLRTLDRKPDVILVPCSGGGLVAGIAIATKHVFPDCEIFAVEPEGFDDTARSLASGDRETAEPDAKSFCDALLVPTPGQLTFSINKALLAGGLTVTDTDVEQAMAFAFTHEKLVVEPGGAVGLAALLKSRKNLVAGKTVVVVLSGGNVDPATFSAVVS